MEPDGFEDEQIGIPGRRPTRLYLMRHGEVEASRRGRYNGHSDVELSVEGILQLEALADRVAGEPIRGVYASDLIRSRTGAEAIARRFGLQVEIRSGFREKNFGRWEGLSATEVSERFPEEWARWLSDPAGARPAGGESYREVYQRVTAGLGEILCRHRGEEVALVAHGGVNRLVLAFALNLDLSNLPRIEQKYGALNIIDFFQNGALTLLVNG